MRKISFCWIAFSEFADSVFKKKTDRINPSVLKLSSEREI